MKHLLIRLVIVLVLITLLWSMVAPLSLARAQGSDSYVSDEVVVKLRSQADLANVASDYSLSLPVLDQFGSRPIFRMRLTDGASPLDRAAQLAADPRVLYAEPNFIGRSPEGQPRPSWPKGVLGGNYQGQWAAGILRLAEAHTITRGAGITVAVLDSGVDSTHPALAGRLIAGYDFVDLDSDPSEVGTAGLDLTYGHGTHVAGLIALVAPQAKIMPIRVLDVDGYSDIWVIAEALAYAIDPDGNPGTDDGADVINLSLSTEYQTDLLAEVVGSVTCERDDDAGEDDDCLVGTNQRGAVVVAAAGNNGSEIPEYPAAEGVPGSLAVGASTRFDSLASFSNHGSWIQVVAPGEDILSSVPGGYAVWSGTSMATPLAAGEAALILARNPNFSTADVVAHMISKTEGIDGPVSKRLDAAAALGISIISEYRCTSTVSNLTADNLIVPPGKACTVNGAWIKGSVKVEDKARLTVTGLYLKGSLQAKKSPSVVVTDSVILGTIQVEEGGAAQLKTSWIGSAALFVKNTGSLLIANNTIYGNLQCKENKFKPTGGGNIVSGNKEDQCSGL